MKSKFVPRPSPPPAVGKPPADTLPAKRITHEEWMNEALEQMNELDKNPELVSALTKRGF